MQPPCLFLERCLSSGVKGARKEEGHSEKGHTAQHRDRRMEVVREAYWAQETSWQALGDKWVRDQRPRAEKRVWEQDTFVDRQTDRQASGTSCWGQACFRPGGGTWPKAGGKASFISILELGPSGQIGRGDQVP